MTSPLHPATDEQVHILDLATKSSDNLQITALAGTGKTDTLRRIERAVRPQPILYLVFNTKNAKEAEGKMLPTTNTRTFNSLGHRTWDKAIAGGIKSVDKGKCRDILRELIKDSPRDIREVLWDVFWDVVAGVDLAKAYGYVPSGRFPQAKRLITREAFHAKLEEIPDDLIADLIDAVLVKSIEQAYKGILDYNDQIYMPALFPCSFARYPLILVDEEQDLNPVMHEIVDKLLRGGNSRHVGVGDPWQSIYAFRGAVVGGMQALATKFSCVPASLSVSFRCPRAVVEAARWRVPTYRWLKEGGHVEHLRGLAVEDIPEQATFLCRNNAPLFHAAFSLLSAGRSVRVAGSDIGPKLVGILRKLGDESLRRPAVLGAISEWQAERLAKGSTTALDMAEALRVFANLGANLGQAIAYAEHLFKQEGTIDLMTGHKAKGLEWNTVYHLDPFLCRGDDQDLNLRYVITTRSADTLYEVDSEAIEWDRPAPVETPRVLPPTRGTVPAGFIRRV